MTCGAAPAAVMTRRPSAASVVALPGNRGSERRSPVTTLVLTARFNAPLVSSRAAFLSLLAGPEIRSCGMPPEPTRDRPLSGPSLTMKTRSIGIDGVSIVAWSPASGATTTCVGWERWRYVALNWAARATAASASAGEGFPGTAMVALRRIGGRKSATVAGGTSVPAKVTEPLMRSTVLRSSRQYPSSGTAESVSVRSTVLSTIRTPGSGITSGARSASGSPTLLMSWVSWVTLMTPDRRLNGRSSVAFSATGARPLGTGMLSEIVPELP